MKNDHRQLLASARRGAVRRLMAISTLPLVGGIGRYGLRVFFDRLAPKWDQIRSDPVYLGALRQALDELAAIAPELKPARVLDVGCGSGLATGELVKRFPGAEVVGVDIAPRMIAIARREHPQAGFEVGDATSLDFGERSFDLVVALDGVFDATELARVCADGGAVVVVYSQGGSIPVSRPLAGLVADLEAAGLSCRAQERDSWVVWGLRKAAPDRLHSS